MSPSATGGATPLYEKLGTMCPLLSANLYQISLIESKCPKFNFLAKEIDKRSGYFLRVQNTMTLLLRDIMDAFWLKSKHTCSGKSCTLLNI